MFNDALSLWQKTNDGICSVSAGCLSHSSNYLNTNDSSWQPAVYTVELSIVFPLLFGMFIIFLYLGFYVHNRAVLEEAAFEAAAYAAACGCENKELAEQFAREKYESIIKDRLYSMTHVQLQTKITKTRVQTTINGQFTMPVFSNILQLIWDRNLTIEAEGSGVIIQPLSLIWLTSILKN